VRIEAFRGDGKSKRHPHPNPLPSLIYFLLPPLAGGSARVPCQIIDLVRWVREGKIAEEKDFVRGKTPSP